MRRVRGQISDVDPGPDQGGLVAHHIHPTQQSGPAPGVPHVESMGVVGGRRRPVGLLQHQVDTHHLVGVVLQGRADGSADEPGRAGEQHLHAGPGIL